MSDHELSDQPESDLGLLVSQHQQIMQNITSLRDDVAVLTAISMRQDGMLDAILAELKALKGEHGHIVADVQALQIEVDNQPHHPMPA